MTPEETVANATAVMNCKMGDKAYRAAAKQYAVFTGQLRLEVAEELAAAKAKAAYKAQLAQAAAFSSLSASDKAKLKAHRKAVAEERRDINAEVNPPKAKGVSIQDAIKALADIGVELNTTQAKKAQVANK